MEQVQQTRATIWRFDLVHGGTVRVPVGAKVLSVAWRDGGVKLWAMVDPEVPKVERRVHLASTGHDVQERWEFCGTVLHGRDDVFLVFLEES